MTVAVPADLPRLAPRAPDSHKGSFGRALLIGGSRGMTGAIALAGMSCLRSGAGLTTLAVADAILDTVAQFDPCYMTVPLDADPHGRIAASAGQKIAPLAAKATCVAMGPGLGRSDELTSLVGGLYRALTVPLIVDADALNALAASADGLAHPAGPRILTPHPGEFARLAAKEGLDTAADKFSQALELARRHGIVIVLKGAPTFITDGTAQHRNPTGNPGLATGGTGDVLTGIITALVCQGLSPLDAARLGVFAHGLAGDLAAKQLGQVAMTARDVIDHLPAAWQQLA